MDSGEENTSLEEFTDLPEEEKIEAYDACISDPW